MCTDAGLFCVGAQLVRLFLVIVCTTTTQDQTCLGLCKPRSSLVTWLASATDSSSCLAQLDSGLPFCLYATSTVQSSVSNMVLLLWIKCEKDE